jgi:predicted ATPase
MVGRETELADLVDRLGSHRLVTVVGPGGVGKTTLARAGSRHVEDRYPLGVRLVDLARIDAPDAVLGSLAAQLGFASSEALLSSPVDQPALVIADNCEHVIDAVADAIGTLLECCAMPTVLATSRSPLGLPGETVLSLAPLAVPSVDDPAAADAPVVQLFLARARDAGATLRESDIGSVVQLCARLDGLPLAVEIAAARTRTMTVADLLARVDEGVDVLSRPRFRGPSRHRSVAEVIGWSTDRLGDAEIDLLERLAVNNGEFSVETARRLGAGNTSFDDAFDELLHASLVSVDTNGDTARYRLLDVVRRFALARLQARGCLDDRYDHFVDVVVSVVGERLAAGGMAWGPASLREAVAEFDDVATAIRWCIEHDDRPHRALSLCAASLVVIEQGRADDIASLTRGVFDRWPEALASGVAGAAEATSTLANAENLTGNPQRGLQLAREALATVTEPSLAAVTLRQAIGDCSVALGERGDGEAAYAEAAATARRIGLVPLALELEIAHAQMRADDGDVDVGLAAIDAAAVEAEANGAALTALWASVVRAWIALRTDRAMALPLIEASLAASEAATYPNGIAANLRSLAFRRLLDGDLAGAVEALGRLRDAIVEHRSLANLRMLVDASAALAHRAGHPAWERLAATVDTLPPATLVASGGFALIRLPSTTAAPLSARDAFAAVRSLLDDARRGRLGEPAGTAVPTALPERPAIRRSGDIWEIDFAGRQATVRGSRGMESIARLLAAPGSEIHCLDLMDAGVEQSSTGEVIDAPARRRYEERIRELQAQIDEAEADNDFGRADRAQEEFDALVEHLAAALGTGGKARRAGDTAERARSAATHRIRSAIRVLDDVHEPLARHLRRSISTGIYCSYRPEHPTDWHVVL